MEFRDASELLSHLRRLDVRLTLDGSRLGCSAPKGVLDAELRAELARWKLQLIELVKSNSAAAFDSAQAARRSGTAVLSYGQRRLWYLDQFQPHSVAYNISAVLRMEGRLDREALQRALCEIIRRHEVLRTALLNRDGMPDAAVMPAPDCAMASIDLRPDPDSRKVGTLADTIHLELRKPFDLTSGNLIRATLIQTGESNNTLILVVHHIAADGWSLGVLVRELAVLYSAFRAGHASPLPQLQLQYADYAAWQKEWLESGALASELPYWRERLNGAVSAELPSDRPRPTVMTYRGERQQRVLPRHVAAAIREFARGEGVTLYTVLLAGFYLLLFRYTRQTDLTIGSAVAGRDKLEFENLIGLFINNLAFRANLDGDPTVGELLARVKETVLGGLAHQHVPFDQLVAALHPHRDLGRPPFFQVMFILQNLPVKVFKLPDLEVRPELVNQGTSRFDLTIEAADVDDSITLDLEYNTDLYDSATIRRLAAQYETLLAGMAGDPARRISELGILSEEERSELIAAGKGAVVAYPHDLCIHDWIEAQCAATPDAIAVVCDGRAMRYSDLSAKSNQLARRLRRLGASPGALVGICMDRSEEMVVAVLGVLKAGAAYVPLDPLYPPERLAFMAGDAGISILITEERRRGAAPVSGGTAVVSVDGDRESIAAEDVEALCGGVSPGDLAYVIFTSGSTGKPKGVQIPHRAVVNFLTSMLREPGIGKDDCLLSVTTLSFDIAGLELFLPLVSGAQVVIATSAVARDGRELARLIMESGATVMQATPATWRLLLEAGWEGRPGLKIICGGEALPQTLAARLLATGAELWNAYGPTETTIWSTLRSVTDVERVGSIGRPIGNTQIAILDDHGDLAPRGAAGEIYIGGDGVARGYLNRPELTRERFIANPFAPGERLYRTGDLGRWLPDGTIEFLGRVDQQVKIRGFRVELGEIEAALEAMPGIRQAAVVLSDDGAGDQRLIAYVSLKAGVEIDAAAIRTRLLSSLPEYMAPAQVIALESIPLTPNGKVDKRALPAPAAAPVRARQLPRSDIESGVAAVWQEVLRTKDIGIYDNFFDVGGHSLLLVQMQNRLLRGFGRDIALQDLFRKPTIAAIAEHLSAANRVPVRTTN